MPAIAVCDRDAREAALVAEGGRVGTRDGRDGRPTDGRVRVPGYGAGAGALGGDGGGGGEASVGEPAGGGGGVAGGSGSEGDEAGCGDFGG